MTGEGKATGQAGSATDAASTTAIVASVGGAARRPSEQATIAGLAGDLLPALIARLDASELGELEVRSDGWRVRLRRPYDRRRAVVTADSRRRRPHPGHAASATAPAPGGDAAGATPRDAGAAGTPGAAAAQQDVPHDATSPAVGYFAPREGMAPGRAVHAGDVLGYVDCLGVRHDVFAPIDGVIGAPIAQPGEAVEYGQALVHVDLAVPSSDDGQAAATPPPGIGAGPDAPGSPAAAVAAGSGPRSESTEPSAAPGTAEGAEGVPPVARAESAVDAGIAGSPTPVGSGSPAARHGTA